MSEHQLPKVSSILLVDDDEVTNFINQEVIEGLGVAEEVHVCSGGQEALDFLRSRLDKQQPLPNIIFLDINMPEMDGFGFLKRYEEIHEKCRATMVTMLSTSVRKEDVSEAMRMKHIVNGYIEKPLTQQHVLEYVQKYHGFIREQGKG